MRPQAIYADLRGQRLTSILVHDPWGESPSWDHMRAEWPLFGAVALAFERHSLLLGSPLRSMRSQQGTLYGLSDGRSADLGFRALLCESEQAEALVQLRLGLPATEAWWPWLPQSMPVIGMHLQSAPWLCEASLGASAVMMLDFGKGQRYRVEYRLDLDGAIELSPERTRCEPDCVEVTRPKAPFGWLHPTRIAGFVLDDQRWRNTERWPIDVRRRLRGADPDGAEVRQLLVRAWLAYFMQNPRMSQRLAALRIPVRVTGAPAGLVEEVRAALLAESSPSRP